MYDIGEISEDFIDCWRAAGKHLSKVSQGSLGWLKVDLIPPLYEHLSFRLGNQLFYIRILDVDSKLAIPGTLEELLAIAKGCNGHPCYMPMKKSCGEWIVDAPGWGLLDVETRNKIDVYGLVTNEVIEMTNWELQDFAVQVVSDYIKSDLGFSIMYKQGNPDTDPSIWFIGKKGPEWVIVRTVRYPKARANLPDNIEILTSMIPPETKGNFASVAVARASQNDENLNDLNLLRGHGLLVNFKGLEEIKCPGKHSSIESQTFSEIEFPAYIGPYKFSRRTENDTLAPGMGSSVEYNSNFGKSTIYIYNSRLKYIPENLEDDLVKMQFNFEINQVLNFPGYSGTGIIVEEKYGTGNPKTGLEFLCAKFYFTKNDKPGNTYLFLGVLNGNFIKLRITPFENGEEEYSARDFADELYNILHPINH